MDKLLTVRDVAGLLHCHPQTVYRNESIPRIEIPGIGIRFNPKDIEKLAENGRSSQVFSGDNVYNNQLFSLHFPIPGGMLKPGGKSEMAKANSKTRYNVGFGAVYQRVTSKGKIRWYLDYRNTEGTRVQKVASLATGKDDALMELQVAVRTEFEQKNKLRIPKENVSFSEFAEIFVSTYLAVERTNVQSDKYRLERMKDFFGQKSLKGITAENVRALKKDRLEAGNSTRTVNRYLALLKRLFNVAISDGYVSENPVKKIKFFSELDNFRSRVLTPKEEERLLAKCCPRLKLVVLFALHTGMRKGEILALKWSQVDFSRRLLHLEHTKGKKVRSVPLNQTVLDLLLEMKKVKGETDSVFPYGSMRQAFENARRRAEIKDFKFHDLRRTFGTRLLERGVDIVTIQRLLGHCNPLVTQRYLHPGDEISKEAVTLLVRNPQEKSGCETEIPLHSCDTDASSGFPVPVSSETSIS